jgi:hypothetical protein
MSRNDTSRMKFYPCRHTRRDGLHYSPTSAQETGRWVLTEPDGTERPIKSCPNCKEEA